MNFICGKRPVGRPRKRWLDLIEDLNWLKPFETPSKRNAARLDGPRGVTAESTDPTTLNKNRVKSKENGIPLLNLTGRNVLFLLL